VARFAADGCFVGFLLPSEEGSRRLTPRLTASRASRCPPKRAAGGSLRGRLPRAFPATLRRGKPETRFAADGCSASFPLPSEEGGRRFASRLTASRASCCPPKKAALSSLRGSRLGRAFRGLNLTRSPFVRSAVVSRTTGADPLLGFQPSRVFSPPAMTRPSPGLLPCASPTACRNRRREDASESQ
jgi:hypothetical protein